MHAFKDLMWRGIWKKLQNFLGSKQGLRLDCVKDVVHLETLLALCLLKEMQCFPSHAPISCPSSRQRQIASYGRGTDPPAPATKEGRRLPNTRLGNLKHTVRNTIIIILSLCCLRMSFLAFTHARRRAKHKSTEPPASGELPPRSRVRCGDANIIWSRQHCSLQLTPPSCKATSALFSFEKWKKFR